MKTGKHVVPQNSDRKTCPSFTKIGNNNTVHNIICDMGAILAFKGLLSNL
jgi:hypothetical protein